VLDRKGQIRHDGGVVASPGLYLIGMPLLRRRKSALIDGAGDDARDLCDHLASHLRRHGATADEPRACAA
jgi:putative flavoprotein involved in K+ transport